MASDVQTLFVTYLVQDRDMLRIWGQPDRQCGLYIDQELSQLENAMVNSHPPHRDRIYRCMFCFAKYKDNTYYRARILSEVQGTKVRVWFLDFGNKDYVDIEDIRVETEESSHLTKIDNQAKDLILANVVSPIGGWSKEVIVMLKQKLCYEEVPFRIVGEVEDQKIAQIFIDNNQDFSSLLCREKIAREVRLDVQKAILESYLNASRQNDFSRPPPGMQPPRSHDRPSLAPKQGPYRQEQVPSQQAMPVVPNNPGINPMNIQPSMPNIPPNPNIPSLPAMYNPPFSTAQINIPAVPLSEVPSSINPLQQINPLQVMNSAVLKALADQIREQIKGDSLKQEAPTPQHYEQPVLEVGTAHNVYVSHVEDGPWSFSVQLLENEKQLESLAQRISQAKLTPIKRPLALGRPCLARSVESGIVFRGIVVNVTHSSIKIFYVDYGNTEDVPGSNVFETPSEFFQIKALSYKFALCGLQKVPVCPDIKECFKDVVTDRLIMLRVTSLEGDSLPTCELYLKEKNVKRILNDNLRLSRLMNPEEFPAVGVTERVVVTWVESPVKFFVNLKRKDGELEQLKQQLAAQAPKSRPLSPDQLQIGQACVCLYSGDQQWYRAVITSIESEDLITVFYVDYGNVDTVSASALRKLECGTFMSNMKTQALRCSLMEFIDRPVTEELSNALESMVLESIVDLKVISHDKECLIVKLFLNGTDVSQTLLNPPKPTPALTPPQEPAYPPKFNKSPPTPVQAESDWGESHAELQQNFGGNKPFNRNDRNDRSDRYDRDDKDDNRNRFGNRPRRFNEGDDDSHNKNSFDKARGNWREDRNKEENYRSNNRRDEAASDWDTSKSSNEDRNQRPERNFNERRSNDRGHQNTTSDWDNKSSNEFGDRNQRSGENNFSERKRFNDRGNFERKNREDDSRDKKDDSWNSKPRGDGDSSRPRGDRDNWGNKARGENDSWGGKPREDRDFGDRKRFDNKDGDDKDRFQKKFGDRPPKYPVRRNDAAPEGSKWADEYIDNGSKHRVIVTYFTNPNDFYVQMLDNQEEFKTMMNEIQTYYSDRFWMREPPKEGDICIAKFPVDKVLYRAQVLASMPLTVQYVDYGNSEEVGNRDVFVVDKKFLDLPKQAVKCKQLKIAPVGGESWPPPGGDVDKFFEYEEYSCHFVNHVTEDNDIFEVELESDGKDIAQEIITAGLAVASGDVAVAAVGAAGEEGTVDAAEGTAQSAPIPVLDLSLLVNQTFNFYIPYIETLSKFYINVYPADADVIQEKVDAFVADEQNFVQLGRENFEVGRLCISTNGTDMWFRARFLEVTDTGANIKFIDYGDSAQVTDDQILIISDELAELPPQAVECSLYGATEAVDQSVHDDFKNTYEGQELICFVNSFADNRLTLSLYDTEGNKLEIVRDINDSPASIEPLTAPRIAHQQTPVFISHFDSPSEIFVQRQCDDEPVQTLSSKLNEFYEANGEVFDPALPENESKPCAGKSLADDSWYRCRLISAAEGNALVQYIDYGNSEEIPVENLKKFDAQFYTFCCYARKVSLYADFQEEKLEDVGNRIQDALIDKPLMAFFKVVDGVTYVELQESGVRFTDLLISEGLCTRQEDIFEDFEFVREEAPVEEVPAQVPVPEAAVEEASGEEETVYVSHADSCYDFYVQKNTDSRLIEEIAGKLENAAEFEDVAVVTVGEMYAALYPEDELWYRAKIEKTQDETEVFFVDYGNKSMVTHIKKLPEELSQIPNLAHRCELAYPKDGCDWTQGECFNKFAEYIGKEPRMVVVLENDRKKFVKLYDGDNSVADLIKEPSDHLLPGITVVHVNSTVDFYVQYSDEAEKLDQIAELLADVENLEDLEDKAQGTKCVAKFPDDEQWYRAVILTDSGDSCEVEFLDYGNTAIVSEIKKSNDDIDAIEKLAYHCGLSNATGSEPEAIQNEFAEFVTNIENLFATDFSPKQADSLAKIRIFWDGVDYGKYLLGKRVDGGVELAQPLETDDDKIRIQVVTVNETDEEKSVKASRQSTEGTSEGFKSDDEKTENVAVPNVVNISDNELIGQEEELDDSVQIIAVVEVASPTSDGTEYLDIAVKEDESAVTTEDEAYVPRPEASSVDSSAWDKTQATETSTTDSSVWNTSSLETGTPRSEASSTDLSAWDKSAASYVPRPEASSIDSSAWDKSQMSSKTESPAQSDQNQSKDTVSSDLNEEEGEETPKCLSPAQSDEEESEEKPEEPSSAQSDPKEEKQSSFAQNDGSDHVPKTETFEPPLSQADSGDLPAISGDLPDGESSPERPRIKQEVKSEPEESPQVNGNHHPSDDSFSPVSKQQETEIKTEPEVGGTTPTRRSRVDKIVPGSISRGISTEELELTLSSTPILKTSHSDKLVPGSICRGISFEVVYSDSQDGDTPAKDASSSAKNASSSAPVTPSPSRKSTLPNYKKVNHQDKIIPGCVSGSPVAESEAPKYEKKPRSEQIIPGVVTGSLTDDS